MTENQDSTCARLVNAPRATSRSGESILPCFECGRPALHDHHVIPRRLGGTKTIPLCLECHGKLHERAFSHPALTRQGIQAAKDRGVKIGAQRPECRNLTPEGRARGVAISAVVRAANAVEAYADLVPRIVAMRERGWSLQDIADRLNFDGEATRSGKPWNKVQVNRVLGRVT